MRALKKNNLANNVTLVTDGEEALDFIFVRSAFGDRKIENRPRMVIPDLKLPKVDGRDVLRAMKGSPRTRVIPVVVLTSSREETDIIETYQLGVNSYIVKPLDFEKFIAAVKDIGFYGLLLNQPPTR